MIGLAALIAMQGASPADAFRQIDAAAAEYRACVVSKTVELGEGNSETADTVLRAVAATCAPAQKRLHDAWYATPFDRGRIDQALEKERRAAEDAGVAALLQARAKRG